MLTPSYAPVDGAVCGMIDGGDGLVWLLYDGFDNTGFAVPFDVTTAQQAGNYHQVSFGTGEAPCRGVAGTIDGRPHLFVMSAGASRLNEIEGSAGEVFWAVDVSDIDTSDLVATKHDNGDDPLFRWGIDDLVVYDDQLFLSVSPSLTDAGAPSDCVGMHCLFEAEVSPGAVVDATPGGDWVYTVMLEQADDVATAQGTVACEWTSPWAGVAHGSFHDGRELLFLGGCTQLAVFDLDARTVVDMDPGLFGQQNLDASLFGQGFTSFSLSLSPDGQTLWALPQRKSPIHFYVQMGLDPSHRQSFNRYMVLPIDLSTGAVPALDGAYASGDIDDYAGPPVDIGQFDAPAADPGVDLNFAHSVVYQMHWLPSTAGSSFQSASIPVGPTFAATADALWIRGSGISQVSGLGKAGDLEVIDLASRSPLLFAAEDEPYYGYWMGGPSGAIKTGFDLTPGVDVESQTLGVVFVP